MLLNKDNLYITDAQIPNSTSVRLALRRSRPINTNFTLIRRHLCVRRLSGCCIVGRRRRGPQANVKQGLMVRSRAHPKQWDVGPILPELY